MGKGLFLSMVTVVFLLGAAASHASLSKIIGENSFVKVTLNGSNVDAPLRPYLDAFGVIKRPTLKRGGCTATHLGNGYVATAGHCFAEGDGDEDEIMIDAPCDGNEVWWGYRDQDPKTKKPYIKLVSHCTRIVYAELSKINNKPIRDFAIFKVDRVPSAKIEANISGRSDFGTQLTTFSYPRGRALEWSQYCNLSKTYKPASNFMFRHDCDTESGSSGSSMLALTSSGIPYLVGIHNGGEGASIDFNYATDWYVALQIMKKKSIPFNADGLSDLDEVLP